MGWPAKKNAAFTLTFPIFDADGDLVSGAAGLDTEVSIDGGTFTDATNEATEIATASGMYKVQLTAAEMNGDVIAVITKTTTTGAKTAPNVIYTSARQIDDLAYPAVSGRSLSVDTNGRVDLGAWLGSTPNALAAGRVDVTVGAMQNNVLTASAIAADAITAAKIADGAIDAATFAAGAINATAIADAAITAAKFAAGAIDANALASSAVAEIWNEAASGYTTDGTFGNILRLHDLGVLGTKGAVNDASATTTSFVTNLTETTNGFYNGHFLVFTSGTLRGQARRIRSYNGATKAVSFDRPLTAAPSNGVTFLILGEPSSAEELLMTRLADVEANADSTVRRVIWAIAKLVNKVDASTTTIAIKKTDDVTNQFTQTATESPTANPITVLDTD
jgi:hypothetical protein